MDFDTVDALGVWKSELAHTHTHTKCNNKCGECMWFDPVYDHCYFFGMIRVDNSACDSFEPE